MLLLESMKVAEEGKKKKKKKKKKKRRARCERCQSQDNDFATSQRILHTRDHQRLLSSHTPHISVTMPYPRDTTPESVWRSVTVSGTSAGFIIGPAAVPSIPKSVLSPSASS